MAYAEKLKVLREDDVVKTYINNIILYKSERPKLISLCCIAY